LELGGEFDLRVLAASGQTRETAKAAGVATPGPAHRFTMPVWLCRTAQKPLGTDGRE
jgi:hypothetical protein